MLVPTSGGGKNISGRVVNLTYKTLNETFVDGRTRSVHPLPVVTVAFRREYSRELEAGL